ncbi:hypothetical protein BK133_14330 [Paenibacillus sp. FSL H8-0548]|uniref:hypothetical protein n=1 Tax=Paenibacillus sp. FSL H8-0548 TaxID=1920422 RepID=UPI00096DA0B4|nr:hypothetical protein [Paenibacillus sp. FSL H8-0548]OMF32198.1 hypothetical protein BK133_14330 [Paenibacillus sp. FSL H8-0548]
MRNTLRRIEWLLLVVVGGFALLLVLPAIDWFDRDPQVKEAKKQGYYYEVNADKQTFFKKKFTVDSVIYGDGKLIVYMTSEGLLSWPNLPNNIQIITDSNEVLEHQSAGASTSIFKSSGYFTFKQVPEGLKSITIFREAYGESISFPVSFEEGRESR